MLLLKLKRYIFIQKEVTLPQLAAHFNLPETVIEEMMEIWVQKKMIEKLKLICRSLNDASNCGSCSNGCAIQAIKERTLRYQIIYRPK